MPSSTNNSTIGQLSITEAQEWVSFYRTQNASAENLLKAFTIYSDEFYKFVTMIRSIKSLTKGLNVNAIRLYYGIKNDDAPCLILVPVCDYAPGSEDPLSSSGVDLPKIYRYHPDSVVANDYMSLCYDFTYPCPATCPSASQSLPAELPATDNIINTYYQGFPPEYQSSPEPPITLNPVSFLDAQGWIKLYRNANSSPTVVQSFTIELDEILDITRQIRSMNDLTPSFNINAMRFTLGLQVYQPESSETPSYQQRLIIVPVAGFDPANSNAGIDVIQTNQYDTSGIAIINQTPALISLCYGTTQASLIFTDPDNSLPAPLYENSIYYPTIEESIKSIAG